MRDWAMPVFAMVLIAWIPNSANAGPTTGAAVPSGSYQRSCVGLAFNPTTQILSATCKQPAPSHGWATDITQIFTGTYVPGVWVATLQVTHCNLGADILNIDGYLQCQALAGSWGQGGAVPNGSYQLSCDKWFVANRFVNGIGGATYSTLTARCDSFDGKNDIVTAQLNLSNCSQSGDIENLRGQLVCVFAANPPPAGASIPTHHRRVKTP